MGRIAPNFCLLGLLKCLRMIILGEGSVAGTAASAQQVADFGQFRPMRLALNKVAT